MTHHPDGAGSSKSMRPSDMWKFLSEFSGARRYVVATALVSVIASLAEASTIALVAAVAVAVTDQGQVSLDLGVVNLGSGSTTESLWIGAGAVAVITAARVVMAFLAARLSTIGVVQARWRVLASYLRASWEEQERERDGHLHELASMHAVRVSQTFYFVSSFLVAAVAFVVLACAAVLAAPLAALAMLVLTAGLTTGLRPLVKRTRRESGVHLIEHNRVVTAVEEATGVTAEVRVFGVTDQMQTRIGETVTAAAGPHMRTRFMSIVVPGLMSSGTMAALVGGLAVIDALSISEPLGLGIAVLLLLRNMRYAQAAQTSAQFVVEQWPFLEELRESIDRYQQAVLPVRGTEPLTTIDRIELVGVAYQYPSGTTALRHVDLTIDAGEVVGIVGSSGGGKTTLVQVLLGLREPTAGRVFVAGIDLSRVCPSDWHSMVAYVGQQPHLISGDVRDNVRFLRADISDAAVDRAIEAAALSRDLSSGTTNVHRSVGEAGKELSGGQRQRIALARAFAGDPQLLVLDEPTSALDVTSERQIQSALTLLPKHVAVVLVAHRPSTLAVCTRVLVMEEGLLREVPVPADEADASRLLALVTGGQEPNDGTLTDSEKHRAEPDAAPGEEVDLPYS